MSVLSWAHCRKLQKDVRPDIILFFQASDVTKEMIFPVALAEGDKDCSRTLYNDTNTYLAGADHIHSYKRKDINKAHSVRQDVPLDRNLSRSPCLSETIWELLPAWQKNTTLINQKWKSYIMCLTTQSTVLFLHCLWNGSIHLPDERENAEDNRTFLHRPEFSRPFVCTSWNCYLLSVCVCVS